MFLGLTVGCARCHEHKYDPISQEDYYGLFSFFDSIEEPGLYSQLPDPNRAHEPFLVVETADQKKELAGIREKLAQVTAEMNMPRFQEDAEREGFILDQQKKAGLIWEPTRVTGASSVYGATLTIQPDNSVLVSGRSPEQDEHVISLTSDAADLRMMMLEALPDPSLPKGRIGRAINGNAVLTGVEAEARSIADPQQTLRVRFNWAWADVEQQNGDYRAMNVLDYWDRRGWAVDAEHKEGGRVLLLVAEEPFGFKGGTELQVHLQYDSIHTQHVLGRVRLTLARFAESGLDSLPAAVSGWWLIGPLPADSRTAAYKTTFGPEQDPIIDPAKNYGFGNQYWRFAEHLRDGQRNELSSGLNVTYVGRRVLCPTARKVELSLGSDDGFALFVNGKQVASREIDRGLEPDQDKVTVELRAGMNTIIMKIVNTGAKGGFYYRAVARTGELFGDLAAALVPQSARSSDLQTRLRQAWTAMYSPGFRERQGLLASLQKKIPEIEAKAPRTMVMQELPKPRDTFVLTRGQYDKPDKKRPVTRTIPAALGLLPKDAPHNRLGLAEWLTAADNPLMARVTVNRLWEMFFGAGLVRTSEDFGLRGEWPSHPELLDWLAVEFRESGWNMQRMTRLILTSNTYRQSSCARPEVRERDPDNRLLAWFPRHRLGAELVRDQALYVSGLLVEKLGGPSVKPYQPDGLWQEVAMPASNTRTYVRGDGAELWRRSLYTYWKRACPPPSLMTFDAPTRESCTVRRANTNTPLQALVLWNDEQFVEAARGLATRCLHESGDDHERLTLMFRRCTGRAPDESEKARLNKAISEFRERYRQSPEDAAKLMKVGVSPAPKDIDAKELAAWTMIANALLNLSATITQS